MCGPHRADMASARRPHAARAPFARIPTTRNARPDALRRGGHFAAHTAQPGFAFRPSAQPGCGSRPSRGVFRAQTAQSRTRNSPMSKRRTQDPADVQIPNPRSRHRAAVEHLASSRQAAGEPGSPNQPDSTPPSPSPHEYGLAPKVTDALSSRRAPTSSSPPRPCCRRNPLSLPCPATTLCPGRAPGAAHRSRQHPRSPSPRPQLTGLTGTPAAPHASPPLATKKPPTLRAVQRKPLLTRWEAERPYGRINRLPGTFAFEAVPRHARWRPYT